MKLKIKAERCRKKLSQVTIKELKVKYCVYIVKKTRLSLKEQIWFLNMKSLVQKIPQGGIVKKEAPIHISNLALIDAKSGDTTRVGYDVREGNKVRVSKKSNEVI